ncbi:MAG: hypothetical protein U0800_24015 [Isosphaeraceae bacterium]
MASERPRPFVGPHHCETADTIREADCGLTIAQGDVDGLVNALENLAEDADLREILGAWAGPTSGPAREGRLLPGLVPRTPRPARQRPRIPSRPRAVAARTFEPATGAAS